MFVIVFNLLVCNSFAQTKEMSCLKSFNSCIYKILGSLADSEIDVSSGEVQLVFELNIGKKGKIESVKIIKSNLDRMNIDEHDVVSLIESKSFPCLRRVYYEGEIKPDRLIIVYNSNIP